MKNNKFLGYMKLLLGILLISGVAYYIFINRDNITQARNNTAIAPKVFSGLSHQLSEVRRIKITYPKGAIQLVRDGDNWVMEERSGFLVSRSYLENFTNAMINLRKGDFVTDDPTKFDTLNVGEPVEFGRGNIVEFFDAGDQLIMGSHIGQKGDQSYVRAMGENRVYSADKIDLDITDIAAWLDINFLNIAPQDIISTQVNGKDISLELNRSPSGDFLAKGRDNQNAGRIATAISHVAFKDVAPATRINSQPILSQIVTLKDGNKIEIKLLRQFNLYWLEVKALGNNDFANNINTKANSWAFQIDDAAAKNFF